MSNNDLVKVSLVSLERTEKAALAFGQLTTPRPIDEYHEDMGDVLWWKFPIGEPPYVGSPNDLGYTVEVKVETTIATHTNNREGEITYSMMVGGWPGYHTHWTPLPVPESPQGTE